MSELNEIKEFTKTLSNASAEIIKNHFRSDLKIEEKDDNSPVTIADKKAEEVMRELIMREFPDHGIMGEEFEEHNEGAEYQWVLDPIDGTKSFISGALSFGTLIALLKNGAPQVGIINHPILGEFLYGDNESTELNDNLVKMRKCSDISKATLLNTDILNIGKYQDINKFNTLAKQVKLYRNWGDCYGYYLMATGYADIMIDAIMSPWDIMALVPIIKGAGGIITDYQGNDIIKGNSAVAASPEIHEKVISILN